MNRARPHTPPCRWSSLSAVAIVVMPDPWMVVDVAPVRWLSPNGATQKAHAEGLNDSSSPDGLHETRRTFPAFFISRTAVPFLVAALAANFNGKAICHMTGYEYGVCTRKTTANRSTLKSSNDLGQAQRIAKEHRRNGKTNRFVYLLDL